MFFMCLTIILVSVGIFFITSDALQRRRCSQTIKGTVVDTYVRVEMNGSARCLVKYYYSIYEYKVNGRVYQGRPRQCSKLENWFQVGDIEELHYNPDDPQDVMVQKNYGEVFTGIAFIVAGIILMIVCKLH